MTLKGIAESITDNCTAPDFTIGQLITTQVARNPHAIAIAAPGRSPLTYKRLLTHIQDTASTLNTMGLGRGDRVAIVLPNGPEMAVSFLTVAATATAAPLNPAYQESEYDFYLGDLNIKALIVQSGMDTVARTVAKARNIPIIELVPDLDAEAGIFHLVGETNLSAVSQADAQAEDIALVLHTSGTTSCPKIVPLTQANLCISARNITKVLQLDTSDRALNIMPLFHIHGLSLVISSLSAGGSVVCTPGFEAEEFFEWMARLRPTWFSAVPTMHQAILAGVETHRHIVEQSSLRLIRSASSSMPPQMKSALEREFNVPVIEAYGMTEAAPQIASNPLPPLERKVGSVGMAAGPEVAIMDEVGNLLSANQVGEIVIRGANVMQGYENNPQANASAFTNGWLRTGDQGYLDNDSYLFVTGRLKEQINRGGEKISPREIDEVLLDHPSVASAVTFAVPHPTLGEDVAAAVVLQQNANITNRELREFAAQRLADFKVPTQVVFVDEIPKGATGKQQRIGLADKLAHKLKAAFVEPRSEVEKTLAKIWIMVLNVEQVGIYDNFFALGGNSLLAVQMFGEIENTCAINLPLSSLFQAPTIAELAEIIEQEESIAPWSSLVAIQPKGKKPPIFFIAPVDGDILIYRDMAMSLGEDQPVYGLQALGFDGKICYKHSIEKLAEYYITQIRNIQPDGPYFLAGLSAGGTIAWAMAQQLIAQGEKVAMLALFDTYGLGYPQLLPPIPRFFSVLKWATLDFWGRLRNLPRKKGIKQTWQKTCQNLLTKLGIIKQQIASYEPNIYEILQQETLQHRMDAYTTHSSISALEKWLNSAIIFLLKKSSLPFFASLVSGGFYEQVRATFSPESTNRMDFKDYVPSIYPNRPILFRASQTLPGVKYDPQLGWEGMAIGGMEITEIPGNHVSICSTPVLAEKLQAYLMAAQAELEPTDTWKAAIKWENSNVNHQQLVASINQILTPLSQ